MFVVVLRTLRKLFVRKMRYLPDMLGSDSVAGASSGSTLQRIPRAFGYALALPRGDRQFTRQENIHEAMPSKSKANE